jgi:hypothetical protein
MLRSDERARRARRVPRRDHATRRQKFFRVVEYIEKIRVFDASGFFSDWRARRTYAARTRSKKQPRRSVKHTERLVKKNSVKRLVKVLRAVESVANRANRPKVIR